MKKTFLSIIFLLCAFCAFTQTRYNLQVLAGNLDNVDGVVLGVNPENYTGSTAFCFDGATFAGLSNSPDFRNGAAFILSGNQWQVFPDGNERLSQDTWQYSHLNFRDCGNGVVVGDEYVWQARYLDNGSTDYASISTVGIVVKNGVLTRFNRNDALPLIFNGVSSSGRFVIATVGDSCVASLAYVYNLETGERRNILTGASPQPSAIGRDVDDNGNALVSVNTASFEWREKLFLPSGASFDVISLTDNLTDIVRFHVVKFTGSSLSGYGYTINGSYRYIRLVPKPFLLQVKTSSQR